MTQEQINEGNKLIALRDGWQFGIVTGWLAGSHEAFYQKDEKGVINKMCFPYKLKYHSSWDWQIPVWAKLIKIYETPSGGEHADYYQAIRDNNPLAGFEIIVSILKRINHEQ